MIRQSGSGAQPKKRRENYVSRAKTGSRESDAAIDTPFDDIDPAEFFDSRTPR